MFSVYLPSVNYSEEDYQISLDTLQGLLDRYSTDGFVLFLGDFNADLMGAQHVFRARTNEQFMQLNNYIALKYDNEVPTFRPTRKLLDYVLIYSSLESSISNNTLLSDDICLVSDHNPCRPFIHVYRISIKGESFVAWTKCSATYFRNYSDLLSAYLQFLPVSETSTYPDDIESLYSHIVTSIVSAGKALLISKYNKHAKLYWTNDVKSAHTDQRRVSEKWITSGRSQDRSNIEYIYYKRAKRLFRSKQRSAVIKCIARIKR